jgi:dihydrofolate synthase/folylpolyglutamate synthase
VGVLAIMRDKGYDEMLEGLLPLLDAAVCTQAGEPRSLPAVDLAAALRAAASRRGGQAPPTEVVPDPHAALERARALAGAEGGVLVTGSLYLLEDLRDLLDGSP